MDYTTRQQWGARHGRGNPTGTQRGVVWHHFYRPDIPADATREREAEVMRQVEADHARRITPSNPRIGYLFVIFQSGRIYEGCGWRRIGAHTAGQNTARAGIAFAVDGTRRELTDEAVQAARQLVAAGIDGGHLVATPAVSGHRDHGQTSCPGDLIYRRLSELMEPPTVAPAPADDPPAARPSTPAPSPAPAPVLTWTETLVTNLPLVSTRHNPRGIWARRVQSLLAANGIRVANTFNAQGYADGIFGPGTDAAVKTFQRGQRVTDDGIVGPVTWRKLLGR